MKRWVLTSNIGQMVCQKECVLDNVLIVSDICFCAKCGIVWKSVECVEGSVE